MEASPFRKREAVGGFSTGSIGHFRIWLGRGFRRPRVAGVRRGGGGLAVAGFGEGRVVGGRGRCRGGRRRSARNRGCRGGRPTGRRLRRGARRMPPGIGNRLTRSDEARSWLAVGGRM